MPGSGRAGLVSRDECGASTDKTVNKLIGEQVDEKVDLDARGFRQDVVAEGSRFKHFREWLGLAGADSEVDRGVGRVVVARMAYQGHRSPWHEARGPTMLSARNECAALLPEVIRNGLLGSLRRHSGSSRAHWPHPPRARVPTRRAMTGAHPVAGCEH